MDGAGGRSGWRHYSGREGARKEWWYAGTAFSSVHRVASALLASHCRLLPAAAAAAAATTTATLLLLQLLLLLAKLSREKIERLKPRTQMLLPLPSYNIQSVRTYLRYAPRPYVNVVLLHLI